MNNLLINDMIIQMQEIYKIVHSLHYFCGWVVGWLGGWVVGWLGGWLENWRVIPISAFNYVIVEVVAEIGNMYSQLMMND